MPKKSKKADGAERLFRQMNDRAYAEAFDTDESSVHNTDYVPEEDEIDYTKDTDIKDR